MKAMKVAVFGSIVLGLASCEQNKGTEGQDEAVPITTVETSENTQQDVPADYAYIVKIGDKAATFTAEIAKGGQITPANLSGKVVMLQFTASWCGVCRKELPHIERDIWQKYKDHEDFVLLGIDKDEDRETVVKFQQDMKVNYPMLLDPGSNIFSLFAEKNAGVTRNVIIDRDGKIVFMTRLFKEERRGV